VWVKRWVSEFQKCGGWTGEVVNSGGVPRVVTAVDAAPGVSWIEAFQDFVFFKDLVCSILMNRKRKRREGDRRSVRKSRASSG